MVDRSDDASPHEEPPSHSDTLHPTHLSPVEPEAPEDTLPSYGTLTQQQSQQPPNTHLGPYSVSPPPYTIIDIPSVPTPEEQPLLYTEHQRKARERELESQKRAEDGRRNSDCCYWFFVLVIVSPVVLFLLWGLAWLVFLWLWLKGCDGHMCW
ncbi:hypothetical protein BDV96DRAFT_644967 [Lophiotrema nucula]|uniref:Uncharacterized protein n=1 Tax=Lophiotrema nucula TaxID=690887 RepID=A0A6A5ZB99_9PLEO|nr:hypothetical protein BDV96DRAFT_644967 [Lophiotrema nucula]